MYSPSSIESDSSSEFTIESTGALALPPSASLLKARINEDEETLQANGIQPKSVFMDINKTDKITMTSPKIYRSIVSLSSESDLSEILFQKEISPDLDGVQSLRPQMTAEEFAAVIIMAQDGIKKGVEPERISAGSSGSYFVKNRYNRILGVFKPKDEEPYSQMNPKWTKWIHRTCCPCCFGRSCILVGAGYISETGASVVDRFLGLGLVPRTEIVQLGSSNFYYTLWEHWEARKQTKINEKLGDDRPYTAYKEKVGSFQIYVEDYKDAGQFLQEINEMPVISKDLQDAFQLQFEKLVILDYVIRNTDRSMDNLLVRLDWKEDEEVASSMREETLQTASVKKFRPLKPLIRMAAIDNGLAFPYKHPENWRSYPYGWADLPYAQIPFSPALSHHILSVLSDRESWDSLVEELRYVFRLDVNFRERHFQRQMAVMRGQLRNIVDCLGAGGRTPKDLIEMEPLLIQEQEMYFKDMKRAGRIFARRIIKGEFDVDDSTEGHPRWKRKVEARPVFSNF